MAERSPKHHLTGTAKGWVKRINHEPRWICSKKIAPTGEDADAYYTRHFADLWKTPDDDYSDPQRLPIADLCDIYLNGQRKRRDMGQIDPRTFAENEAALQDFCDAVGADTRIGKINPDHFRKFELAIFKRFKGNRRKKWILFVRSLFKWAAKAPVRLPIMDYGDTMRLPSQSELRRERKRHREQYGSPIFTPAEIRAQLEAVTIVRSSGRKMRCEPTAAMRAMVLLGINCGFGNTDLAEMPLSVAEEIKAGWVNYARGKTGADRRAWVWPETQAAVAAYLKTRPRGGKHAGLLFLTSRGTPFLRFKSSPAGDFLGRVDRIHANYRAMLRRLGQTRRGRGWYALRRTFRTLAAETGEELAIDLAMGHAERAGHMAKVYTHSILDEKIKLVCSHVRSRIFGY